jgi:hypothetical protein
VRPPPNRRRSFAGRLLAFTACLLASLGARPVRAGQVQYAALSDTERNAVAEKARGATSMADRLRITSDPFVGTPYGNSPLGEGVGVDPDPRLRWDVVDCLTFVETSIALAVAPSQDRLLSVLDDIRYASLPPSFEHRNHFTEAQWVPHNVEKGYIRSISREIAGDATVVATTKFSLKRWHARRGEGLELADSAVPIGDFSLDLVPLEFAKDHVDRIPTGSLLLVVRNDFWRNPTRVSHVGFVLESHGRKILRHASRNPYGRVVDEPLAHFFERNARYDKRPVTGFALFEVRAPVERMAGLALASSVK